MKYSLKELIPAVTAGLLGVVLPAEPAAAQESLPSERFVDASIAASRCEDYDPRARSCGGGDSIAFSRVDSAVREAAPGMTVWIQPGRYEGGIVIDRGGSALQPLVFRAAAPGVVIDGGGEGRDALYISEADHVVLEGITVRNARRAGLRISLSDHVTVRDSAFLDNGSWGIFTDFSDHTTVENCEAAGSLTQHGIYISNSSGHPIIRGNRIHHNATAGIHMNGDISMGGDGVISHALIENNVIYENGRRGASGINLDGVTDSVVRNNLLYRNFASGISLYRTDGGAESERNLVANNTVVMATTARWALNLQSTGDNKVFNNILLNDNPFRGSILARSPIGAGFESDHNVVKDSFSTDGGGNPRISLGAWRALGHDSRSLLAGPAELFVDARGDDYRLKEGSPAIDAGVERGLDSDLAGAARPRGAGVDIGAYEY